jgi:Na+-driven multidrug efflux pump
VVFCCYHSGKGLSNFGGYMMAENKMAVLPVGKLIFEMSLPPLFSMFLQYSYNLLDSAFVARLSENALTAVSLSFPITTLMNAVSI